MMSRNTVAAGKGTLWLYAVTLLGSALLLFSVQPMVGKMLLPILGGTPGVWNTCMVFFQAVLLAGYAYAHGSVVLLGVRRQAAVHIVVLLSPLLLLPIVVGADSVPTTDNPVPWLLGRLLLGVGVPFFVVSTSAPLLQRWFSRTDHPAAHDPYFLYAASNTGSLVALLGYPVFFEPALGLADQSWAWAAGYGLLIVMVIGCAIAMWRCASRVTVGGGGETGGAALTLGVEGERSSALTMVRRLRWIALALVPSSLMLGVTTHITTDIAPVPLLWVVPLALYLLSFVLVFARKPLLAHSWMGGLFPFVVAPVSLLTFQNASGWGWISVPAHLLLLFVVAMVCHGELAKDRPSASRLTEYYFWLAVGGVLGGSFNAIVAPLVFDSIAEYPLMAVLACVVLARRGHGVRRRLNRLLDVGWPVVVGLATAGLLLGAHASGHWAQPPLWLTIGVPAVLCVLLRKRPLRFGLGLGAVMLSSVLCFASWSENALYKGRNFFGTKEVAIDDGGNFITFVHGSTIHGIQRTATDFRRVPMVYFHPTGPVGDVFRTARGNDAELEVAIIGLGAGSMASYAKPGQHFTFYEIDPEVERIARETEYFTFLADCRGTCDVIVGDGRLTLGEAPDGRYGMIFLDAFSSDAVPTHLLTKEALRLYLSKLDEGGMLIFNITNRYLSLEPMLGALAAQEGLVCLSRLDPANEERDRATGRFASHFLVMARQLKDIRRLDYDPNWKEVPPRPGMSVWTDQYSNIFSVIRRH